MSGGTIQGIGNKEIYLIFQDEGDQNFKKKKDITKVIQENMYPPGKKYENKRRKK